MYISTNTLYSLLISGLLLISFGFLGYIFLIKRQDSTLNWALFYSFLYVLVSLPIVNFVCIKLGLWTFTTEKLNAILLPFDLYFLWLILWSIIPVFFLRGKHIWIIALILFWLDILIMPVLQNMGMISLGKNWLYGEVALILFVFIPSYFWAYCFYNKRHLLFRALFQIVVMTNIFIVGLPFILHAYGLIETVELRTAPFILQLFLIMVFPALIAVLDLVQKGKGTPFPYDPTQNLVRTGIYAYCKNPIQWSFTLMFIPMSMYFSSFYLLIGVIISIAYAYGVSDFQEYEDMKIRFGEEWNNYKLSVPKWQFLWKPKSIPKGLVYFDFTCKQCSQLSRWFTHSKAINLVVKSSSDFPKQNILQVTYIDHNGLEYKSVKAIACCFEHINLAYATLGWFMRFPGISHLLQAIINTMEMEKSNDGCEIK